MIVSGLLDDPADVDLALDALYTAGIPRDLIEIVVSRDAARRFYAGDGGRRRVRRTSGRESFRWAGIGGLAGFVSGVVLSFVMVAWPGMDAPGGLALVQLLGPNFGTVTGAALGAVFGWFRRQRADPRHARAAEASHAIVIAVEARDEREAATLAGLLTDNGARDVRRDDGDRR